MYNEAYNTHSIYIYLFYDYKVTLPDCVCVCIKGDARHEQYAFSFTHIEYANTLCVQQK